MSDDLSPDDERALAALYREVDDEEPPAWGSVRDVVSAARASGFDEEPPPRVDALLMAAARAHAPRPRAGWWTRLVAWMRPVIVHPAMAGALALVVVVGIGGVMYRRGQVRTAQPIPQRLDPPAPALPSAPSLGPQERREVEEQAEAGPAREVAAPEAPPPRSSRPPRPRPPIEGTTRRDVPAPATGGAPATIAADEAAPVVTLDDGGKDQSAVTPPADPAPPAGPPPPPVVTRPDPAPRAMAAPEAAVPLSKLKALLADAQRAAAKGDCATVAALSAKVRAIDAAFHRTVFATDRALAGCLARPAN